MPPPSEKDQERVAWEAEAREVGLKPDSRWSLDRLKMEIEAKMNAFEAARGAKLD